MGPGRRSLTAFLLAGVALLSHGIARGDAISWIERVQTRSLGMPYDIAVLRDAGRRHHPGGVGGPGRHEPARAALPVAGGCPGTEAHAGRDRQHHRHPRRAPAKGYVVYSAAKAGLSGLTRALARELAPEVRVKAVAPGPILWPEDSQFDELSRQRIVSHTPLKREGSPDDIARAVHSLLVDAPNVTGETIAVDGGRHMAIWRAAKRCAR